MVGGVGGSRKTPAKCMDRQDYAVQRREKNEGSKKWHGPLTFLHSLNLYGICKLSQQT